MLRIPLHILTKIHSGHIFEEWSWQGNSQLWLKFPCQRIATGELIETDQGWILGKGQGAIVELLHQLEIVGILVTPYILVIMILPAGSLLAPLIQSELPGLTEIESLKLP